jgi:hypothetical protein
MGSRRALILTALMIACSVFLMALPTPSGLSPAGQRVLAVAVLAIGLWCAETVPAGVTGLVIVAALVLSGGVPGLREALSGFAEPVAYFLIGVLTLGLAVSRSGWRGFSWDAVTAGRGPSICSCCWAFPCSPWSSLRPPPARAFWSMSMNRLWT